MKTIITTLIVLALATPVFAGFPPGWSKAQQWAYCHRHPGAVVCR